MRARLLALLLPAVLMLAGCAASQRLERRAEAVIRAQQETATGCEREGECAIATPFAALVASAAERSTNEAPAHYLTLLEEGEASLALRVHLMRAARRSIELQTFIFSEDDAGLLTLNELLAAARRGVHVRLLLDQPFSLDNLRLLSRLARAHQKLELRLYNPTFDKAKTAPLEAVASVLCCFRRFNQRMHNKTMVVDDEIGLTGGRNVDERYFDLSDSYNYRDRDVLVVGPEARRMRESFDRYWRNPSVVAMSGLRDVAKRIVADSGKATPTTAATFKRTERIAAVVALAADPAYIEREFIAKAFKVGAVEYFADDPDKHAARNGDGSADLTARISELVGAARQRLVLQTPYLILSKQARQVMQRQRARHPDLRIIVSTNSLAATDAFYVYAISHKYKRLYMRRLGLEIYEYKPFPDADADTVAAETLTPDPEAPAQPAEPEVASAQPEPAVRSDQGDEAKRPRISRRAPVPLLTTGVRRGMHSKSLVVDGRIALIGSHNFDPRSDDYNTEAGLIVRDEAFAQALEALILADTAPKQSWTIARRPQVPVVTPINGTIARVSEGLPIFDLWPFRYATSYELKPGCEPMAPRDPRFQECYVAVGEFPGVNLSLKQIYTRMIMAFGAGLAPIL